ncbi:hypothetical protein, partial [Thomasclavelia cocleata]
AIKYNPSSFKSANIPEKREEYMNNIFNNQFDKYSKKYTKLSLILRLKIFVARLINNKIRRDNFEKTSKS